jgi:DNA-binding transcriptional LysR family regulator
MADLDSRLLRAFVAVAEELNFTRAAQRLHLAQQALSAQIQQLETRVGERLFDRTTRSVVLTDAGERLLPHALAVLAALDAGLGELEATRRAACAKLRVGLATTAVIPLVGETLRHFAEDHPDIHLAVSNHGMIDPSAGLRTGTADVGFVRPPFTDDGVVAMETVLTEPRYIVLREGHPLAERESLRPEDVVGEPWIYVEGADPKTRAFWSLEEFRDEPLRTGTRVNSFEEAFAAVLAGLAITCQGESAIRTVGAAFPQLRPVPLEGVEPARVAVAWRHREETELTRAFVATALAVATNSRTR